MSIVCPFRLSSISFRLSPVLRQIRPQARRAHFPATRTCKKASEILIRLKVNSAVEPTRYEGMEGLVEETIADVFTS